MKLTRILTASLLCFAMLAMTGCGNKDKAYKKATGTVTLEGQPLEGATITFYPVAPDGEGGSGRTIADGTFEMTSPGSTKGGTGVKPGEYKVTIVKYEDVIDPDQAAFDAGEITYDELQERKLKKGPASRTKPAELLTPQEYSNTNQTTLTATVTDDPKANVFNFDL